MKKGAFIKYVAAAILFALPFTGGMLGAQGQGGGNVINRLLGGATADNGDTSHIHISGRPTDRTARENAPRLDVKFIPDSIAIGDLVTLQIDITKDIIQVVALPEFDHGTIGDFFEIVAETDIDTVRLDGRRVTLRKTYTLQTFEDGYLNMGWFPAFYLDKNIADTIWSQDLLLLKVGTFEIDTLSQTIHDIRGLKKAPFKPGEVSRYVLWAVLALALIAALVWLWIIKRRNLNLLGRPRVVVPPHVVAIKALETVHNQKLWQNNRHKQYYTAITDILREYLEKRYYIPAMEMTSEEIITALRDRELPDKAYADMQDILRTADLVKFATYTPDPEQNENVYTEAYYFVEQTKPTEIEETVGEEGVMI